MKLLTSMIYILTLSGCASSLPYTIAIGDPSNGGRGAVREQCVLRLDDIVQKVATADFPSKSSVRSLQVQFEKTLYESTQALDQCKDRTGRPVQLKDAPPIEEVAKKWLTSYALDATDPNQDLDRFQESVRSAVVIQQLAARPLLPDEDPLNTYNLVEPTTMRQAEWCGNPTGPTSKHFLLPFASPIQTDSSQALQTQARTDGGEKSASAMVPCLEARSLYHVTTTPAHLYEQLLLEIAQVKAKGTQRNQRYFVLGYEIPWDAERTRVRYGVAFYFRQTAPEDGTPASDSTAPVQLIGYDLTYANEATPAPLVELEADGTPKRSKESISPWQDNPWRVTGYPFSLAIGLKNAAFEIVKLPFKVIAGLLSERDAHSSPLESVQTAYDALYVESTMQTRGGAEWGLYRLLTEIPLVGPMFQYNFGSIRSEKDEHSPDTRRKLFLSRGIYGGNKWQQATGLWALFAKHSYPGYDIYSAPYRHGAVTDVVWSMLHLSHGPAYSEVRYIMDHASREDRLYLAGHSGGVQRSVAASRILSAHGYQVVKVVGFAGPSIGVASVDSRYPEAFKVYLNTGFGANQDIVSIVGGVAHTISKLLDFVGIVALRSVILGILPGVQYSYDEPAGFSNITIVEVIQKPSSRHETPMRFSFTDRLVFDAYIRNEFSTVFREDLERPDHSHEVDRPHAFPWKR